MTAVCCDDGCIGEGGGGHEEEADGAAEKISLSGGRCGNGGETIQ